MTWRLGGLRALLLAVCISLSAIVSVQLLHPSAEMAKSPVSSAELKARSEAEPVFAMAPLEEFSEVIRRPLFSETRRGQAMTSWTASLSPPFTLAGTIVSPAARGALIALSEPDRLEHVTEGQQIDGWELEQIFLDRVILRRADERTELRLGAPSPLQPSAAPAAAVVTNSEVPVVPALPEPVTAGKEFPTQPPNGEEARKILFGQSAATVRGR